MKRDGFPVIESPAAGCAVFPYRICCVALPQLWERAESPTGSAGACMAHSGGPYQAGSADRGPLAEPCKRFHIAFDPMHLEDEYGGLYLWQC